MSSMTARRLRREGAEQLVRRSASPRRSTAVIRRAPGPNHPARSSPRGSPFLRGVAQARHLAASPTTDPLQEVPMFFEPPIGMMDTPSPSRLRPRRLASVSRARWSLTPSTSTAVCASERQPSTASRSGIRLRDPVARRRTPRSAMPLRTCWRWRWRSSQPLDRMCCRTRCRGRSLPTTRRRWSRPARSPDRIALAVI